MPSTSEELQRWLWKELYILLECFYHMIMVVSIGFWSIGFTAFFVMSTFESPVPTLARSTPITTP